MHQTRFPLGIIFKDTKYLWGLSKRGRLFLQFFSGTGVFIYRDTRSMSPNHQYKTPVWQHITSAMDWIGLCSVLRPHQHSIGYMGESFYRSKDPTNSIKVLKEITSTMKIAVIRLRTISRTYQERWTSQQHPTTFHTQTHSSLHPTHQWSPFVYQSSQALTWQLFNYTQHVFWLTAT